MVILVCGGRDYLMAAEDYKALDKMHAATPVTLLIHGDAPGADRGAALWAEYRGIPIRCFPADWERYGKSAGPMRNEDMLRELQRYTERLVVAFPGGKGTANMVKQAQRAGVDIVLIETMRHDRS